MNRNLESSTQLTEFAPLSPEPHQPTVGLFLSRIFKFSRGASPLESAPAAEGVGVSGDDAVAVGAGERAASEPPGVGALPSTTAAPSAAPLTSAPDGAPPFRVDTAEGRSLPNVLKRISNLLALKSSGLQAYKDTDFKQYWMPDSVSKECYDCGERFTTFRRRHHCRVCGQIFCARCCGQEIPGKIMGCTGDLRVCRYCSKVVLTYLQSDLSTDLPADLRALSEDLQLRLGGSAQGPSAGGGAGGGDACAGDAASGGGSDGVCGAGSGADGGGGGSEAGGSRRVSRQEDRFGGRAPSMAAPGAAAAAAAASPPQLTAEERVRALRRSTSLRALYAQLTRSPSALQLRAQPSAARLSLRAARPQQGPAFTGADVVDWLRAKGHATSRAQASALAQALLDGGFMQSAAPCADPGCGASVTSGDEVFEDGPAPYRPLPPPPVPPPSPSATMARSLPGDSALWGGQDSLGTDSEPECHPSDDADAASPRAAAAPNGVGVGDAPGSGSGSRSGSGSDGSAAGGAAEGDTFSLPSSSSTFYLDLSVESRTVSLSRARAAEAAAGAAAAGGASPPASAAAHASASADANAGPAAEAEAGAPALSAEALPPSLFDARAEAPARPPPEDDSARDRLEEAYAQHEAALLRQLLRAEGLSAAWEAALLPLVDAAADAVRPPPALLCPEMDVRRYVQFKKVCGGVRADCQLVRGLVCTKNVSHRAMPRRIAHPRILCVGCAIAFRQRVEGRLQSLEPLLLGEREYLRNVVMRLVAMRPSLVLVARGVARPAQELLLNAGVALALNVKASVLARVARCTGAIVLDSVDAHVAQPRLGTCKLFSLHTFRRDPHAPPKTLLFLEGCAFPCLSATVLLRGGGEAELRRVKRVAQLLLLARYGGRLERAFLLAEGARPPSPPAAPSFCADDDEEDDQLRPQPQQPAAPAPPANTALDVDEKIAKTSEKEGDTVLEVNSGEVEQDEPINKEMTKDSTDVTRADFVKAEVAAEGEQLAKSNAPNSAESSVAPSASDAAPEARLEPPSSETEGPRSRASSRPERSPGDDRRAPAPAEAVCDFSDPLRRHARPDADEDFAETGGGGARAGEGAAEDGEGAAEGGHGDAAPASSRPLPVAKLPRSNRFREALAGTLLAASPYLLFPMPRLETEAGLASAMWRYLPRDLFWSAQFCPVAEGSFPSANHADSAANAAAAAAAAAAAHVPLRPAHPFVSARFTCPASSREVQALLANFRACGGRLPMPPPCPEARPWQPAQPPPPSSAPANGPAPAAAAAPDSPAADAAPPPLAQPPPLDVLDPHNHQHMAVLYCSYAFVSSAQPTFCVDPWVVHMGFYDSTDVSLERFLERHCFRTREFRCPKDACEAPLHRHVRRFVHDGACLTLYVRELQRPLAPPAKAAGDADDEDVFATEPVLAWSWCLRCSAASPTAPLSGDARALSFAKFLELRFHAPAFRRRSSAPGAAAQPPCAHSLHREHVLCLARRNVVASFHYTPVTQWEVSLPPPLVALCAAPQQRAVVIEELKQLALRGYELFSTVSDRLGALAADTDVSSLKAQLAREQAAYKTCIEDIQLRLTSPTLETRRLAAAAGANPCLSASAAQDVQRLMWPIEDALVVLKRSVADAVESWNARLLEAASTAATARRRTGGEAPSAAAAVPAPPPPAERPVSPASEPDAASAPTSPADEGPAAADIFTHVFLASTSTEAGDDDPVAQDSAWARPEGALVQPGNVPEATGPATRPGSVSEALDGVGALEASTQSTAAPAPDDKPSQKIKSLLSQLRPSAGAGPALQSPLSPTEHPAAGPGWAPPVVVYEAEPSSVVACALASPDYRRALDEIKRVASAKACGEQPLPSPLHKRRSGGGASSAVAATGASGAPAAAPSEAAGGDAGGASAAAAAAGAGAASGAGGSRRSGVLSFLRGGSGGARVDGVQYRPGGAPAAEQTPAAPAASDAQDDESGRGGGGSRAGGSGGAAQHHVEVQWADGAAAFFCRVYFAAHFCTLRAAVLPAGEEAFVRSLARCVHWAARGGKSGSSFCKTRDDRFVLKEMSRVEMQLFLDFAPHYFSHVHNSLALSRPTLLGKIVGVFRIKVRTSSGSTMASNLLVMENLFFRRHVTHKFDLKGSMRNRLAETLPEDNAGEMVLLDENLLKMTCDSPLYVYPHSKAVLMQAINSDTEFLASQAVMDYSLLVGLDQEKHELVVGIIDYIRTFTWDKKLEAMVKYYGQLGGGQARLPTVVSPEVYRNRFIVAMHRYFLPVPDRWTHLGQGLKENAYYIAV